jgi:hypothetical protein
MKPKFLAGEEPEVHGKERRKILAAWLASPRNPWFARNLANMVWAHFLGRGIVHEPDDVRVSNPPSNEELLDELAKKFTEYRYDFRRLVRDICTSRVYGQAAEPNETNANDERNFSHAAIRRLRAEVLLDAITQATDTSDKFPGLPKGARAVQIADGTASTYFLTAFGRAQRKSVCSCEVKVDPNLSQALHLLNGSTVEKKISEGDLIGKRLKEKRPVEEIVEELYVRCFSREPTESETKAILDIVSAEKDGTAGKDGKSEKEGAGEKEGGGGKKGKDGKDAKRLLEDLFWALLNSREFLFNH